MLTEQEALVALRGPLARRTRRPTIDESYLTAKYHQQKPVEWDAEREAIVAELLSSSAHWDDDRDLSEKNLWPLVDLWVRQQGLGAAFEVLSIARKLKFDYVAKSPLPGKWQRLRRVLLAVNETDYQTARVAAERMRAPEDWLLRCLLAYAFPAEPWGDRDASELLSRRPSDPMQAVQWENCVKVLLPSLSETTLLEAMVECASAWSYRDGTMTTLVARFGSRAVPWIIAQTRRKVMVEEDTGIRFSDDLSASRASAAAALLLHVESPEVASRMVELVTDKWTAEQANAYLNRYPELGIVAFAKHVAVLERPSPRIRGELKDLVEAHPRVAREVAPSLSPEVRGLLGLPEPEKQARGVRKNAERTVRARTSRTSRTRARGGR